MKIFISADIEGTGGIACWEETTRGKADYTPFLQLMQGEVAAACRGAEEAGATAIVVRDAHETARNLTWEGLPESASLLRGFNGHPLCMMYGLDKSFDAVVLTGYHACGGSAENPLSHTLDPAISQITINGTPASEFLINAYAAAYVGVPVVFVSGDAALCREAQEIIPGIETVATMQGAGQSVLAASPQVTCAAIRRGVAAGLRGDLSARVPRLPETFAVEITYKEHPRAYRASFYPGAQLMGGNRLAYASDDYFEVLRLFAFVA